MGDNLFGVIFSEADDFTDSDSDYDAHTEELALAFWHAEPSYREIMWDLGNLRRKMIDRKTILESWSDSRTGTTTHTLWYVRPMPLEPAKIWDLPGTAFGIKGDQPINSFGLQLFASCGDVENNFQYWALENELLIKFCSMEATIFTWNTRWGILQRATLTNSPRSDYKACVMPRQLEFLQAWERTKYQHYISWMLINGGEITPVKGGPSLVMCPEIARAIASFLDIHPLYWVSEGKYPEDPYDLVVVGRRAPRQKICGKRVRDGY